MPLKNVFENYILGFIVILIRDKHFKGYSQDTHKKLNYSQH